MSCLVVSSTCSLLPFDSRSTRSSKLGSSLSWQSSFPKFSIDIGSVISSPIVKKVKAFSLSCLYRESLGMCSCMFELVLQNLGFFLILSSKFITLSIGYDSFIQAAWTRRSRGEAAKRPNKKSWKQRTDMYMRPFLLNVFFSRKFIHAKVMHRPTSKVISVATTNARDIRTNIPSLVDDEACRLIGKLIAERSMEADVYAVSYEPRKGERIEGKLGIVIDTIKEHGIVFVP
ncbi:hypothetical protein F2Q68_00017124 [Brassica cretica]|uniref:50S ribosomal protein L18 n=2 Tax=Brassica cretica TaxID=69181 RepID=A0A8S9HRV1_BRACR|nr:hypothetical protein F2Q68_00017124 [Brassica cretica]